MKSKIIIGTCAAVAIALLSTAYVCNINSDSEANVGSAVDTISEAKTVKNKKSNNGVKANFSEIRFSQDQLIRGSELVVRCTFTGEKETKEKTTITTADNGKKISFTAPVTTYKMKTVENLKGSDNDYINIVTLGSGNDFLETGDEYVLFLNENKSEGTYRLISYSQGLNIIKEKTSDSKNITVDSKASDASVSSDEALEIESAETNEVMNYKELKDKIKELEK